MTKINSPNFASDMSEEVSEYKSVKIWQKMKYSGGFTPETFA